MTTSDKNLVKNSIKTTIKHRIGADAYIQYAEIIEALAYACTFKNPRCFADIDMNERTWQDLASSITVLELQSVSSSLAKFTSGNRLFYTLGCLARTYSRRKCNIARTNYVQRRYTVAELEHNIVTPAQLANIEW